MANTNTALIQSAFPEGQIQMQKCSDNNLDDVRHEAMMALARMEICDFVPEFARAIDDLCVKSGGNVIIHPGVPFSKDLGLLDNLPRPYQFRIAPRQFWFSPENNSIESVQLVEGNSTSVAKLLEQCFEIMGDSAMREEAGFLIHQMKRLSLQWSLAQPHLRMEICFKFRRVYLESWSSFGKRASELRIDGAHISVGGFIIASGQNNTKLNSLDHHKAVADYLHYLPHYCTVSDNVKLLRTLTVHKDLKSQSKDGVPERVTLITSPGGPPFLTFHIPKDVREMFMHPWMRQDYEMSIAKMAGLEDKIMIDRSFSRDSLMFNSNLTEDEKR